MTARLAPRVRAGALCPKVDRHTDGPENYVEWHEWARARNRTHYQERCPGCGLYLIWRRRPVTAVAS